MPSKSPSDGRPIGMKVYLALFLSLVIFSIKGYSQENMSTESTTPREVYSKKSKSSTEDNVQENLIIADTWIQDSDYVVGPGDLLNVSLGSMSSIRIGPDGMVFFPGIPPIEISDMTLKEAKKTIKQKLSAIYDTSKIFITLASTNLFKVPITGEVGNPGVKKVNSFTRVKDVIDSSGGFTRYAIRNKIILIHGNGDTDEVEIANYFKRFHDEDNPLLKFGDRILVSKVDFNKPLCVIRTSGDVFYNQLDSASRLTDIYLQITNYSQASPPRYARVITAGGVIQQIPPNRIFDFTPKDNDTVELKNEVEQVFVGGSVARPGGYDYVPDYTPSQYIFLAGISPSSASTSDIVVFRNSIPIDLDVIYKTGIKPGDLIYLDRQKLDVFRDYLSIVASLAGIALTAVTLYFVSGN